MGADIDIEAAYATYGPMVLRRCRRLLNDDTSALDVMQDVFVALLRHQSRLEPRGLSSLLYTIATRLCCNHLRQRRRRGHDRSDSQVESVLDAVNEQDKAAARSSLRTLFSGPKDAANASIAVMYYVDGMTYEEIAATVGLSFSGVRKRLKGLSARLGALESQET